MTEQPYNITAKDVPPTFIIARGAEMLRAPVPAVAPARHPNSTAMSSTFIGTSLRHR
jgi:hypothetical protein